METPENALRSESTSSRSPCTTVDARREVGLRGIADERADVGAALDELFDDLAADSAGGAGNEDGHGDHSGLGWRHARKLVIHIRADRRYIWTDRLTGGTHGFACPR